MSRLPFFIIFLFLTLVSNVYPSKWIKLDKSKNKIPRVQIISQSETEIILEFRLPGFEKNKIYTTKEIFDMLDFEGSGRFSKVGIPDLPYISKLLAINTSGTPVAEIIEKGKPIILKNYNVAPVRKSWIEGEKETPYIKNNKFFSTNEFFPRENASFDKPGIFRNFRIARLSVYPIKYNPVTKELEVTTYLKVKITYKNDNSPNEKISANKIISPTFDRLYRSIIFNYDEAKDIYGLTTKGGSDLMLCIMPDNFYDSFQQYANWKKKTGIRIKAVKFSDIGANANDPEIIKSYISQQYFTSANPPSHVLLIGDKGVFPVKYVSYDWTFVNEDYFVEVDGDDYFPDMLIGRFTNQGDYRLRVMIDKFIKYEQLHAGDDPEWFTRAAVCSNNNYESQVKTKRFTAQVLREDGGFTVVDTLMSKPGCPYGVEDIKEKINAGISFLNYRGEGWNDGWHASCYYFVKNDVTSLHNEMKLPFVTSIGCGVAMFDASGGNCFGETWVQLGAFDFQRGAAAFVGPTSNTHTTYNNRIDKGIYVGMFREGLEQPAEALLRGKFYMYNVFGDELWVEYHFRIYTTLGDPSIHIWKGTPNEISITAPDTIGVGYNQISINVYDASRQPIKDAQIILYNDNIYSTSYTDLTGTANFDLTVEDTGKVFISVRGSKVAFYEDSIYVNVTNENVGIFGEPQVNDTEGKGDGYVEPNENFSIKFILKNWGTQQANNVTAKLSVPDSIDFLIIDSDSTISCGNIAPNDTTSISPFLLHTTENAVIDSTVSLVLNVNTSNNSWNYIYRIKIDGCKLRFSSYSVDDANSDIPNNRLDPGETGNIFLDIINLGNDTAKAVYGKLRSLDQYVTVLDSVGFYGNISPHHHSVNLNDSYTVSVSENCPDNYKALMQIALENTNGNYPYSTFRTFYLDIAVPIASDPTGPDNYGYYAYDISDTMFTEAPKFNWIEIENVGTEFDFGSESDYWQTFDLPFQAVFYGNTFNQITISTDGWAAFGTPNVGDREWENTRIPVEDGLNNLLSAFWDDYISQQAENAKIYYYYDSSENKFIIEWKNVDHYEDPNSKETFEIVIYDPQAYLTRTGDCEILFQYKNTEESESATIGIENDTEDDGIQFVFNGNYDVTASEVQDDYAIKFTTDIPVLVVGVNEEANVTKFELKQNYPNPFNPTTTIEYSIPNVETLHITSPYVRLKIYDVLGREIKTLVNEKQTPGKYKVRFDASGLSSGIYFYRLIFGNNVSVKKMILLK